MYNNRIYLTPQEILDKEFKIDARGYRPQEVDKYLDLINLPKCNCFLRSFYNFS